MATALCRDTAGWTNPYGEGRARFVSDGHCGDGGSPGHGGRAARRHPEIIAARKAGGVEIDEGK